MSKIHDATGQRIGQLIHNSLYDKGLFETDEQVGSLLFYVSDEVLIEAVKEYLAKSNPFAIFFRGRS